MRTKFKHRGFYTYSVDLSNINKKVEKIQSFLNNDGMGIVAHRIINNAHTVIRERLSGFKRSGHESNFIYSVKRRNKERPSMITELFNKQGTVERNSPTSYKLKLIARPGTLQKQFPHVMWQEYGTKAMVHLQAYLLHKTRPRDKSGRFKKSSYAGQHWKMYNITEKRAKQLERRKRNPIYRHPVYHPALPARHFIRAGAIYMKLQAPNDATKMIREML